VTRPTNDTPGQATVHQRVQSQFGAAAEAYGTSLVHADTSALQRVVELASPKPGDAALDLATGAGHTALALAPRVARVIAYDLTREMLLETRRNAAARGLANVHTQQGPAEKLPFRDASFDIVTVRQAPHHFADVRSAIREMARVAKQHLAGRAKSCLTVGSHRKAARSIARPELFPDAMARYDCRRRAARIF